MIYLALIYIVGAAVYIGAAVFYIRAVKREQKAAAAQKAAQKAIATFGTERCGIIDELKADPAFNGELRVALYLRYRGCYIVLRSNEVSTGGDELNPDQRAAIAKAAARLAELNEKEK